MKRRYFDSKDLNIASYVVFGKTDDGKLYTDAALTTQASATEVADAFVKNLLTVVVGDVVYKPVKLDGAKVTVIDVESSIVTATEFEAAE